MTAPPAQRCARCGNPHRHYMHNQTGTMTHAYVAPASDVKEPIAGGVPGSGNTRSGAVVAPDVKRGNCPDCAEEGACPEHPLLAPHTETPDLGECNLCREGRTELCGCHQSGYRAGTAETERLKADVDSLEGSLGELSADLNELAKAKRIEAENFRAMLKKVQPIIHEDRCKPWGHIALCMTLCTKIRGLDAALDQKPQDDETYPLSRGD